MKMPEKNPELLTLVLAWLTMAWAHMYAPVLSVTIAVLRVICGGGTGRQMIREGALCGLATLTLIPLLEWAGLPSSMATFIGGATGFVGVEKLRDMAVKFGERKADGK